MKFLCAFSSVAIVCSLGVNSGAALARSTEQASTPISSGQAEPILMADFFGGLGDALETIGEVRQTIEVIDTVIDQENERREQEAAEQAAAEQARLEAERRQQYFESLSPEERQAFLEEEQRARQAQSDREAALWLGIGALMLGGSSSEPEPAHDPNDDFAYCGTEADGVWRCQ